MTEPQPSARLRTWFAPAKRATPRRLEQVSALLAEHVLLREMIDAVPVMVAVLNEQRQIVAGNAALKAAVGDETELLGLRPGEALQCQRSDAEPGGCGTSRFCQHCGTVNVVMASADGDSAVDECRIVRADGGTMDLRVWARRLEIEGEALCVMSLLDISDEKRREALERVFFHDVLNTAGGVLGCLEISDRGDDHKRDELVARAQTLATRLVHEIKAQRELRAAEEGGLQSEPQRFDGRQLMEEVRQLYALHRVAEGLQIIVSGKGTALPMECDRLLLSRVLGNMVKNALEASLPGDQVTLSADVEADEAVFSVHNPTAMPLRVQRQVFQRSFSTKGPGRGLGTYGMRLLAEGHLNGSVDFNSASDTGTTFRVRVPLRSA